MPTSPEKFSKEVHSAVRDLIWRQWISLGVSAESAEKPASDSIIDPEALLLATTWIGRHETRLFDEVLDWLVHFGSLINLQRLKNLQSIGELGQLRVLRAMAAVVHRHGGLPKWGTLSRSGKLNSNSKPEPFFVADGFGAKPWAQPDTDFMGQGWLRSPPRLRGLSMPPKVAQPANSLLALRALMGVSSRCEIILCLLSRPSATAAELARFTGYSSQAIQAVLKEMELSGCLFMDGERSVERRNTEGRGKSRRYSLRETDWEFVVRSKPAPKWVPWAAVFCVTQGVAECLSDSGKGDSVLLGIRIRRVLETHAAALSESGIASKFGFHPNQDAGELVASLATHLPEALRSL